MYRIGIDVGGTFTDVTLLNAETGAYYTYKLSSTLHDQSEAIANGTKETLELYGIPVDQLEYFGHGTTVATNMIIERKGAKTALLTTKGFRDLLEIGRQVRPLGLSRRMGAGNPCAPRIALRGRRAHHGRWLYPSHGGPGRGDAGARPPEEERRRVGSGVFPFLFPESRKRADRGAVYPGDLARGLLLYLIHHSP